MKKLLLATVAAAGLALASPAFADTFEADNVSVLNGINVTIDTPVFENVQSGMIQLTGPNGLADVWCLDIFDGIHLPYTYTLSTYAAGDVRAGMPVLTASQVQQIAALMFLGNSANTGPFADAVIQLAIWNVEYGGAFTYSAVDSATRNSVNTAILDTDSGGIFDRTDLVLNVLTDAPINPSQAFGDATLLAAVPEPSTWAMMLLGFAGIATVSYRRRKSLSSHQLA
jgi:PEP-CTERM motif